MLVGSREFIAEARVARKMLGGGMRQAGILAAAGLVALEESPQKLHIDHENARWLAEALAELPGISIDPSKVVTNILILNVAGTGFPAAEISRRLLERGVLANEGNSSIELRMVTHYDLDRPGCERAVKALKEIVDIRAAARA
jgi:threonine aldolase